MSESWNTSSWGDACGPKPKGGGGGAGVVTVTETGSELLFQGSGFNYSTANCFEAMPGLKRTSHSGGKRGWSSTCASPAGDPRRATVKTTISATDDAIAFSEVGVFEFVIDDTTCKATMSRSKGFTLKERAGSAKPTPTEEPPPPAPPAPSVEEPVPAQPEPPASECDPNEEPARFELAPARKLVRPGDVFAFRAAVFDARGCRLARTPTLALEGPAELTSKVTVDGLTLTVAGDAPEGTVEVVATLAGEKVRATAEVTPIGSYDELLRVRGLDARGEDARPLTATLETSLGSRRERAQDEQGENRIAFVAAGVGVASVLAIAALVLARRGRRAASASEAEPEALPAPTVAFFDAAPGTSRICTTCDATYDASVAFCEVDGSPLVPLEEEGPTSGARASVPSRSSTSQGTPSAVDAKPGMVCPSCGDLYPKPTRFCGRDGTELMPVNG